MFSAMLGMLGKIATGGIDENVELKPAHVGRWSLIFIYSMNQGRWKPFETFKGLYNHEFY